MKKAYREMTREELEKIKSRLLIRNLTKRKERLCVRFLAEEVPAKWNARRVRPDLEDVYLYYFADREDAS